MDFNPYFPGIIIATPTKIKVELWQVIFQSLFSWNHHCNIFVQFIKSVDSQYFNPYFPGIIIATKSRSRCRMQALPYFNPYFPGIIIATSQYASAHFLYTYYFNPYFPGIIIATWVFVVTTYQITVISILIFLESSLQHGTNYVLELSDGSFQSLFSWNHHCNNGESVIASYDQDGISILIFLESSLQHRLQVSRWCHQWYCISILIFLESSLQHFNVLGAALESSGTFQSLFSWNHHCNWVHAKGSWTEGYLNFNPYFPGIIIATSNNPTSMWLRYNFNPYFPGIIIATAATSLRRGSSRVYFNPYFPGIIIATCYNHSGLHQRAG